MNKPRPPSNESADADGGNLIHVELTEAECSIIQHALLMNCVWNRQEDDEGLHRRHNEVRNTMIDAHEEWLEEEGMGR